MMRVTLFRRGDQDRRIKQHLHHGSVRAHCPESFIAHVLQHARPLRVGRSRPPVHPEPIHVHHRGVWHGHPELHPIRVFVDLQFHIGFQHEPISERFRHDDPTRFINLDNHAIYDAICHNKCHLSRYQ
jgi:hypothetical protein